MGFVEKEFVCPDPKCAVSFDRKDNLHRHMETYHRKASKQVITYVCSVCRATFTRNDNLQTHIKNKHGVRTVRNRN